MTWIFHTVWHTVHVRKKPVSNAIFLKQFKRFSSAIFWGAMIVIFIFQSLQLGLKKLAHPTRMLYACRLLKVIKRESSQEKPMFRTLCFAFLSDSIFFFQVFTNGMYDCKSLTMRKYFSFRRQKRNSKLIKYFIYSPQRWQ